MKVLLRKDVDNLGYAGEVMNVADGYGRNYLLPQGLAVKATPGVLREAEAWRERAAARVEELMLEHKALADRIVETKLEFIAKAGETGKLYGSVTTGDIADKLNEALGTEIDRRKIVGNPLRQLGEHKVMVRLSRDYQPQVEVHIRSDEEESVGPVEIEAIEGEDAQTEDMSEVRPEAGTEPESKEGEPVPDEEEALVDQAQEEAEDEV